MSLAVSGCRGETPAVIGQGWPAFDFRGGTAHRAVINSGDAVPLISRRNPPLKNPLFILPFFWPCE